MVADHMVDAISLHGAGRAWWRQKAVRRRLGAALVQVDRFPGHFNWLDHRPLREREGEVKTANVLVDPPSEREIARRERLKREG
jgi:hypothetical protein